MPSIENLSLCVGYRIGQGISGTSGEILLQIRHTPFQQSKSHPDTDSVVTLVVRAEDARTLLVDLEKILQSPSSFPFLTP